MRNKSIFSTLLAGLFLVSCGKKVEQAPPSGPMPLQIQTVTNQDAITYQEYTAKLQGQQNVEIRPKVTGFIQQVLVDEGQEVRKGQLLFKLETQSLSQDAAAAKANIAVAQVEVDRLAPLVARKIISNVQLATAKARLAQAKSAYGSIAANINYANVISPVNGVIGSIPYKVGALVSSAIVEPLTTVSDSKVVRAYFSLNEKQMIDYSRNFTGATLAEKIKNTPPVSLKLVDNSIYDEQGKIATINGLIDPNTGTTQFRADFKNPQAILRSGSSGTVQIPITYKEAILVPQFSVIDLQGKKMVYVLGAGNKVKSKAIEIIAETGDNYIVKGIEAGEKIVVEGVTKLADDMQIDPQNKPTSTQTETKKVTYKTK